MDRIQSFIEAKDYNSLVGACERIELQRATVPNDQWDIEEIYALLLLGYVLIDDLNSARYLRKRILSSNRRTEQIDAAWRICAALWERQFQSCYQALNEYQWSNRAAPLVVDIRETLQKRVLALIRKAYTSIHKADAAQYFGISEDEVVPALMSEGFEYNGESGILTAPKLIPVKQGRADLDQFSRLANVVLQLENH
ncbi:COP9 signalosome [Zychaea mexicana]|uniref:COP9 signalosome n=1 Tax=Zychaea mexicana TaxID=64656 RepID=UPI0022FF1EB4|nr:COP9 signalosome [Zychaea mexicana]KAI9490459.1 COP9 signalosome [Zychaea mexicana]